MTELKNQACKLGGDVIYDVPYEPEKPSPDQSAVHRTGGTQPLAEPATRCNFSSSSRSAAAIAQSNAPRAHFLRHAANDGSARRFLTCGVFCRAMLAPRRLRIAIANQELDVAIEKDLDSASVA